MVFRNISKLIIHFCKFVYDLSICILQEVEREISFRTESGLYYSYYKQLVNTPSFVQGDNGMHTVIVYKVYI